jgi:hypothetical protein
LTLAYIATLGVDELCNAATIMLDGPPIVRRHIYSQLYRRAKSGSGFDALDALIEELISIANHTGRLRVRIDSILSHLYEALEPTLRSVILDYWWERGTPSALSRWLNAMNADELHFDCEAILAYWRVTRDARAARIIAHRMAPLQLTQVMPELILNCGDGRIISRAALRVPLIHEECWDLIRSIYPVSYIYLCAMTGRPLDADDAFTIAMESEAGFFGDRGVAIWAIGQIGLWEVLERIQESTVEYQ